jgi:hypothetical protein
MEDSIVKVVQQLTDECVTRGIDASLALVAYTVRSIITSRIEDFQVDVSRPLSDDKMALLHNESLALLDVGIDIKLSVTFSCSSSAVSNELLSSITLRYPQS